MKRNAKQKGAAKASKGFKDYVVADMSLAEFGRMEINLAEHEMPVMNICLGYFDKSKTLHPRRPRRGFDEIAEIV